MLMTQEHMMARLQDLDQQIKDARWWGAYLSELYEERKALLSNLENVQSQASSGEGDS